MTEVVPLIYFSHAELKQPENIQARLEHVNLHTNSFKSRHSKRLKLSIEDDEMNYEAIEEDDAPFLIGVLDKETKEISVCNTSYFVMKPECYLGQRTESENLSVNQQSSYSEKLNALTAAFGSSKKRKAMQTKLKNKIDTDTLETAVSAAVEESKKNQKIEPDEDKKNQDDLEQFSILPVPNKNAKTPQEVYDLNEILGLTQAEFDRFTIEQSTKFASATTETIKKWKTNNVYSEYVCEHAILISGSKSSHQYKLLKSKQLVYMSYLMMLYRLKSAQLRAKNPFGSSSDVPDVVANRLLDNYTVLSTSNAQARNVRSMPRRLKDKLICHILILALFIDDFTTSLDLFQKDLKLSIQKLSDFYQALGCFIKNQVSTVNDKKVVVKKAELKIPINETNRLEGKKRARKT